MAKMSLLHLGMSFGNLVQWNDAELALGRS